MYEKWPYFYRHTMNEMLRVEIYLEILYFRKRKGENVCLRGYYPVLFTCWLNTIFHNKIVKQRAYLDIFVPGWFIMSLYFLREGNLQHDWVKENDHLYPPFSLLHSAFLCCLCLWVMHICSMANPFTLSQNTKQKEYMHPYVHSSIIYNNQDLETAQISISRWAAKMLQYIYTMEHWVAIKKKVCDSIDKPGDYYKWSKPIRKRQIPYDLTYMWNLKNKINWWIDSCQREGEMGRLNERKLLNF